MGEAVDLCQSRQSSRGHNPGKMGVMTREAKRGKGHPLILKCTGAREHTRLQIH